MGTAQPGTGPLIAVAYDDWALGWSIRDALEAAGYRVRPYRRATVPFLTVKRHRPALLVIERAATRGGLPLLDRLRDDPETAAIPVVLHVPRAEDLPAPSARLRVVPKGEPIGAVLDAVRDLLAPEQRPVEPPN